MSGLAQEVAARLKRLLQSIAATLLPYLPITPHAGHHAGRPWCLLHCRSDPCGCALHVTVLLKQPCRFWIWDLSLEAFSHKR